MRTRLLALGASLLFGAAARADPIDLSLCFKEPASPPPSFGLARITGAPKTFLRYCPPGAAGCHEQPKTPYVIPGDTVIIGARTGGAVCAFMPSRRGGSSGWIGTDQMVPRPDLPAPLRAWPGRWVAPGGDEIDFELSGDKLHLTGSACWPSCDSAGKQAYGPNVGDLDDTVAPVGDHLTSNEGDGDDACKVEMWLVGPYLLAFDNRQCGGMNVSFTGVYQRREAR